jgi:branched-chain amino acid transport system permease protein
VVWPIALLCCGLLGAAVGYLALRTRGVQFIMITLAFAQLVYFVLMSLQIYGGDDGLMMQQRNTLPGLNLDAPHLLLPVPGGSGRLDLRLRPHRQLALRHGAAGAAPERAPRRQPGRGAHPYRLGAFVLSAIGTGLAGVLWANYAGLVTPTWRPGPSPAS